MGQFASAPLMFPDDLELDALFEDHGVSSTVIEDMLTLERAVYQRCTPGQLHLSNKHVQQAEVRSLLAKPRCRRCSPDSQC